MNTRKRILWITQTAMLLAIAVLSQSYLMTLLGGNTPVSQLAVGSIVNFCLVLSTLTSGFWSGASIAIGTTFIAYVMGRIVYPQQVLIVILGNLTLVAIFWLFCGKKIFGKNSNESVNWAIASIIGSVSKFIVLWFGMTKIFIEFVLKNDASLPAPRLQAMTAMITMNFTWTQIVTALTGSIIAFGVYKVLKATLLDKLVKSV